MSPVCQTGNIQFILAIQHYRRTFRINQCYPFTSLVLHKTFCASPLAQRYTYLSGVFIAVRLLNPLIRQACLHPQARAFQLCDIPAVFALRHLCHMVVLLCLASLSKSMFLLFIQCLVWAIITVWPVSCIQSSLSCLRQSSLYFILFCSNWLYFVSIRTYGLACTILALKSQDKIIMGVPHFVLSLFDFLTLHHLDNGAI